VSQHLVQPADGRHTTGVEEGNQIGTYLSPPAVAGGGGTAGVFGAQDGHASLPGCVNYAIIDRAVIHDNHFQVPVESRERIGQIPGLIANGYDDRDIAATMARLARPGMRKSAIEQPAHEALGLSGRWDRLAVHKSLDESSSAGSKAQDPQR